MSKAYRSFEHYRSLAAAAALTAALLPHATVAAEEEIVCVSEVQSFHDRDKLAAGDFSPAVRFSAYGPGAGRAYEVSITDGKLFLASPGEEGVIDVRHRAGDDDGAAMLQLATPKRWVESGTLDTITSFDDLNFVLDDIVYDQGCGDDVLLPFKIVGHAQSVTWSMDTLPEERVVTDRDQAVELVGLYNRSDKQRYFMVPGYNLHAHVILPQKDQAGHLRSLQLSKGATLYLPGQ